MGCNNQPTQILQQLKIKPIFTILHFNDVYDIQAKKGKGGVCNFKAKLQELRQIYPQSNLTLFSGDAFSPSILSRTKKGWQMVKALNALKIDASCYGNHQFDYEEQHTIKLAQACNFPWLLGNITNVKTGKTLGNGIPYITKTLPNGMKLGIFGVAGQDWIGIMGQQYEGLYECQNPEDFSVRISAKLKNQQKCDFVIALTHMRNGADLDLSQVPADIDIILGGHDHVVMNRCIQGVPIIKSGSNFHQVGVIQIYDQVQQYKDPQQNDEQPQKINTQYQRRLYIGKHFNFSCQVMEIPVAAPQKIDPQLKAHVDLQMEEYTKFDKIVGYSDCLLQARFSIIRTQESNYGNWFADLFRHFYDTDIAFLNSGCIRNDLVLPQGTIKLSKLTNIIQDLIIVKSLPGTAILKMLEYAVKGVPNSFMGSFLLVSGIKYTYDYQKSPKVQSVEFNGAPLDLNRQYTVAMPSYMGNGADGYQFIKVYKKVVDQVRAISIISLLLKFFQGLDQKYQNHDEHHDSYHHHNRSAHSRIQRIKVLRSRFMTTQNGQKLVCICPKIDNRIICLNSKKQA